MPRHQYQPRHYSIAVTILFLINLSWLSMMKTGTNNNNNNNHHIHVLAVAMTAGPSGVVGDGGGTQHNSRSRNERIDNDNHDNDNDNNCDKQTHNHNKQIIVIVGGGLAGLSVSLGLAKLGYRVEIVERRHDWGKRKGGTYLMQPNAVRALEQVCQEAMDPLYEMGVPIPHSECKMYAWWMVRDALLKQVLLRKNNISLHMGWSFSAFEDDNPALIKARFTRTQQTTQMHTQQDDETQRDNEQAEEDVLELTGIMVVGADGVHSAVRASLDLAPATHTGSVCWRGSISLSDNDDDDNETTKNARQLLAPLLQSPLLTTGKMVQGYIKCGPYCVVGLKSFHSKYPGVMTWTVNTREPEAAVKFRHPREAVGAYLDSSIDNNDDDDDDDDNKKTAALIEAVFALADPEELSHSLPFVTITLPEESQDSSTTNMKENNRNTNANANANANGKRSSTLVGWGGSGRVTLIGDAAHAMRSAGGQGGAMAFEDCVVLARILEQTALASSPHTTTVHQTHTRASIESAILEFESRRLPRVRTIWKDQWERAERAYQGDFTPSRTVADEQEYQAWVDQGV